MKTKLKNKLFYAIFAFCVLVTQNIIAQNCSVNAGGDVTVCDDNVTLQGSRTANFSGNPSWSLLSFTPSPGGSSSTSSVNITSPNSLTTGVSGLNTSGDYVFQIVQPCTTGGNAVDTVTITVYNPFNFTAGSDISGICSSIGTVNVNDAFIPPGFTANWSIENIFRRERFSEFNVSTNGQLSDTTIENPTFSLINKNDHQIDPAYDLILTITSLDGSCSFTARKSVTFCPNPNISIDNEVITCNSVNAPARAFLSNPPFFADTPPSPNSAGSGSIILNVVSQPTGANFSFNRLDGDQILFNGASEIGLYTYNITVNTCCGNFTTPNRTIDIQNNRPSTPDFTPPGYPEQLSGYLGSSSENQAGEVKCDLEGTTNIECFYFDINPQDDPNIPISITTDGGSPSLPPGASSPTYSLTRGIGGNPRRVEVCVNPGASGWLAGTYSIRINTGPPSCFDRSFYKMHISDSNRVDLAFNDQVICTSGAGSETAIIDLPPTFLTPASNLSYFDEFGPSLRYFFTVISKPAGSSNPVYTIPEDRQLIDLTTTIANLDTPGDYVFGVGIFNGNASGPYVQQEYACSGAQPTAQFTITLEPQQTANAGSSQSFACASDSNLVGNAPVGTNTGQWQLVSKPSGASDPNILEPSNALTSLNGLDTTGEYTFSWTITSGSGNCVDTDQAIVNIQALSPDIDNIITTDVVNGSDGTIDITASNFGGGTLTYTITSGAFSETNTTGFFDNLDAGDYDVVVSNATCDSLTEQVTIIGDPCDASTSSNPDTDGDGVTDICDLDDDNDGILDTVEDSATAGGNSGGCNTANQPIAGVVAAQSQLGTFSNEPDFINDGNVTADVGACLQSASQYMVIDLGQVYAAGSVVRMDIWGNNTNNRTAVTSEVPSGTYSPTGGSNSQTNAVGISTLDFYEFTLSSSTQFLQIDMTLRDGGRTEWVEVTITTSCN